MILIDWVGRGWAVLVPLLANVVGIYLLVAAVAGAVAVD